MVQKKFESCWINCVWFFFHVAIHTIEPISFPTESSLFQAKHFLLPSTRITASRVLVTLNTIQRKQRVRKYRPQTQTTCHAVLRPKQRQAGLPSSGLAERTSVHFRAAGAAHCGGAAPAPGAAGLGLCLFSCCEPRWLVTSGTYGAALRLCFFICS